MNKDESQAIERMLASLSPQDHRAALGVLERESLSQTQEISSTGEKTIIPEEQLQKDSRRTVDEAVQGVTVEYLVSLITKKDPTICAGLNQGGFLCESQS